MIKKGFILIYLILGLIGYGVYWAFFDMDRLPKGNLISKVDSPKGTYTIKTYVT